MLHVRQNTVLVNFKVLQIKRSGKLLLMRKLTLTRLWTTLQIGVSELSANQEKRD